MSDIDVVNIILIDQILNLSDAVLVFSLENWIVADHRHPSGCMFDFFRKPESKVCFKMNSKSVNNS